MFCVGYRAVCRSSPCTNHLESPCITSNHPKPPQTITSYGVIPHHATIYPPPPHTHHSSESEKNRRRDLITTLRARREQLQQSLKRGEATGARSQLFGGGAGNNKGGMSNGGGRETDATAGLDTTGLLQLQRDVMQDQDEQLDELEKTVTSTRVCMWWGW